MRWFNSAALSLAALSTCLALSVASAQVVPDIPIPPLPEKQQPVTEPPAQTPPPMPGTEGGSGNPPAPLFQISLVGTWDGVLSGAYGYSERHYVVFYDNDVFDSYVTSFYTINGQVQPLFNVRVWGTYGINATDRNAGFILTKPQGAQPPEICTPNMPCQAIPLTPAQVPFTLDAAGNLVIQTQAGMKGTLKRVQ